MSKEDTPNSDSAKASTSSEKIKAPEVVNTVETTKPATEEQLQDVKREMNAFERSTLRWTRTTTGIGAVTALFIAFQWQEMRSGSADTHSLAEASKTQAIKITDVATAAEKIRLASEGMVAEAKKTAENSQKAIAASNRQSKASLDASIVASRLEQRAWVAVATVTMDAPEIGKTTHVSVSWQNTGRTFAKRVKPSLHDRFVQDKFTTQADLIRTAKSPEYVSIGVLSPGAQYKSTIDGHFPVTQLDKDRISGAWFTYIWGELSYEDVFGNPHSTTFCSYRQGSTGDFVQCPFYNDAN